MTDRTRRESSARDARAPQDELAARRRRAAEEPLDIRVLAREPFVRLEVRNPLHRTRYLAVFPGYPARDAAMCTCTDFARRGLGSCKHLEAAWTWLEEHPLPAGADAEGATDAATAAVWPELDRRLERLRRTPPGRIGELEAVGGPLFETDPAEAPTGKDAKEEVGRRGRGRRPPRRTSRGRP